MSTFSGIYGSVKPDAAPRLPKMKPRPQHHCRLELLIDGVPYSIRQVPCEGTEGNPSRCWRLRKPDGTEYHVSKHPHGGQCTCPSFIYRHDGLDAEGCKHVVAMTIFGLLDPAPIRGGAPGAGEEVQPPRGGPFRHFPRQHQPQPRGAGFRADEDGRRSRWDASDDGPRSSGAGHACDEP